MEFSEKRFKEFRRETVITYALLGAAIIISGFSALYYHEKHGKFFAIAFCVFLLAFWLNFITSKSRIRIRNAETKAQISKEFYDFTYKESKQLSEKGITDMYQYVKKIQSYIAYKAIDINSFGFKTEEKPALSDFIYPGFSTQPYKLFNVELSVLNFDKNQDVSSIGIKTKDGHLIKFDANHMCIQKEQDGIKSFVENEAEVKGVLEKYTLCA